MREMLLITGIACTWIFVYVVVGKAASFFGRNMRKPEQPEKHLQRF